MQRSLILIGAVLAFACATQPSGAPPLPATVPPIRDTTPRIIPFEARSTNPRGVVTDHLAGIAEVRQNDIRVFLRSGVLELTASSGARPAGIRAALAYGNAAGWNIRSEGSFVPVSAIPARGDTLTDIVMFTIPRPDGRALSDHWIVLLLQAEVNVPGRGWVAGSFRPIHSPHNLFAGLIDP